MTDIDWSKAPEGATHYLPETISLHASWGRKNANGEWETWVIGSGTRWVERAHLNPDRQMVARPWTGEGLPPVETVCEYNAVLGEHPAEWHTVEVVYSSAWVTVIRCISAPFGCQSHIGMELSIEGADAKRFRPIRTPEQIAEEEREKAIAEINEVLGFGPAHDVGERLYLAGYRKREAV